jgi:hypothetical protein
MHVCTGTFLHFITAALNTYPEILLRDIQLTHVQRSEVQL